MSQLSFDHGQNGTYLSKFETNFGDIRKLSKAPDGLLDLRPGDYVRVKSPQAILDTLDDNGCLEKMPFMPEMFDSCGQVFNVYSRADKTCDTATKTGGRRLTNSVHLTGERCDGSAHGGCQAACLNFWKEAWLEPIGNATDLSQTEAYAPDVIESAKAVLSRYATIDAKNTNNGNKIYSCQATQLPEFTVPLRPFDLRQYWRDVAKNKVRIGRMFRVLFYTSYHKLVQTGIGHRFWVWAYNSVQKARDGQPWPFQPGTLDATPTGSLDLESGEYVRVKSFEEIRKTLGKNKKNRGLSFDAEMVRHCGKTFRVRSRVDRLINEESGEMLHMKNPCIILEDAWCSSDWSACRRFCPRSIYHYWRELWLERVPIPADVKKP
jgi:hypothetical protein